MLEKMIKIHDVRVEGVPNHSDFIGRMAFIFDGCIVSGWPLSETDEGGLRMWEADSDVGRSVKFSGVTHWVEFPDPIWEIPKM